MIEDMDTNSSPNPNNDCDNSCSYYLSRAAKACAAGNDELGLHLYLAAYERGCRGSGAPDEDASFALRKAWVLAVQLKERSLAEYIFEKLEPLLDPNELSICAGQLQSMALEKLEEFGLSREELQEMTDMISQDFLGFGGPARLMKVEHMTLPPVRRSSHADAAAPASAGHTASSEAEVQAVIGSDEPEGAVSAADGSGEVFSSGSSLDGAVGGESASASETLDGTQAVQAEGAREASAAETDAAFEDAQRDASAGHAESHEASLASSGASNAPLRAGIRPAVPAQAGDADNGDAHAVLSTLESISYKDLAGYGRTIKTMRDFGIGMQDDVQFQGFVDMLNRRHGLERMPAADSFLFRSPAREDAHRFMIATLGELGLPAIRMHMEENLQGAPVLCVMAQADNHPRLNAAHNAFEGPGVLLLEDLDLWESPMVDTGDDFGNFMHASLSRGAREAINLIRSAVENPDVFVLASSSDASGIDGFFYDLLEPLSVVDIDHPDDDERREIWMDVLHGHPSLRGIDVDELVRFSSGMPRYDMYMATREAIEDAYKLGLMQRRYVPVSLDNLYEKLAAYQPLDSQEYRSLEDAVVREFRRGLDGSVDDLLKG